MCRPARRAGHCRGGVRVVHCGRKAGNPKHKLFQRLTANRGYPRLREHLGSVVTIMKLSRNWKDFRTSWIGCTPRYGDAMLLPFDDDATDSGTGL